MSGNTQGALTQLEAQKFLQKFHSIGDSLQASRLDEVYAQDATLLFNNLCFEGWGQIHQFFSSQFNNLQSMKHDVIHFATIGNTIYQAATITYVLKGDPEQKPIPIRGMANYFLKPPGAAEQGKIERFEVYLDPTSLMERMRLVESKAASE